MELPGKYRAIFCETFHSDDNPDWKHSPLTFVCKNNKKSSQSLLSSSLFPNEYLFISNLLLWLNINFLGNTSLLKFAMEMPEHCAKSVQSQECRHQKDEVLIWTLHPTFERILFFTKDLFDLKSLENTFDLCRGNQLFFCFWSSKVPLLRV